MIFEVGTTWLPYGGCRAQEPDIPLPLPRGQLHLLLLLLLFVPSALKESRAT